MNRRRRIAFVLLVVCSTTSAVSQPAVLVDHVGYRPSDEKKAILKEGRARVFEVIDVQTNKPVYKGHIQAVGVNDAATGDQLFVMDFSGLKRPGMFQIWIREAGLSSEQFRIDRNVYWPVVARTAESFYFQRCGTEVGKGTIWHHPPCHGQDASLFEKPSVRHEATGGWHDAGDYGKFVATGAVSAALLLYAYEDRPDNFRDGQFGIPESNNGIPDILDEVRWELQWLLKMQGPDGGVYHKTSTKKWTGEYLPQTDPDTRYTFPVSSAATGAFAAVTALGARHFDRWDKPFARQLLRSAMNAWKFLQTNPDIVPSGGFKNPQGVEGGEYGDTRDTDERLWASVELYRLTGNVEFQSYFLRGYRTLGGFNYALSWQHVQNFAYASYLEIPMTRRNQEAAAFLETTLFSLSDELLRRSEANGYRTVLRDDDYYWGSNSVALGYAHVLVQAAKQTQGEKYTAAALDQVHYILGRNTFDRTFVTGMGSRAVSRPYHQFSMMLAVKQPVPGLVVGGPNKNSRLQGKVLSSFPGKCYEDREKNYFVNEVAINYTAPLLYLASYLSNGDAAPNGKQNTSLSK